MFYLFVQCLEKKVSNVVVINMMGFMQNKHYCIIYGKITPNLTQNKANFPNSFPK